MKFFKDTDDNVFAFEEDGSQNEYISSELIRIDIDILIEAKEIIWDVSLRKRLKEAIDWKGTFVLSLSSIQRWKSV